MNSMNKKYQYDENNIFLKIINNELEANVYIDSKDFIVIYDINPCRKTHLLYIPKLPVISYEHLLSEDFSDLERKKVITGLNDTLAVLKQEGITEYTLITNSGKNSEQQIFHLHFHILSHQEIKSI